MDPKKPRILGGATSLCNLLAIIVQLARLNGGKTYTIHRDSGRHQPNGQSSNEPTSNQHGNSYGTSLQCSSKARQQTPDEQDQTTAPGIGDIGDNHRANNGAS